MMATKLDYYPAAALSPRTLATALKSRNNNFDVIRLAAALLVIFSHSYPILHGKDTLDPLQRSTDFMSFGDLAVAVFFIISGLLVAGSYVNDPKPLRYLQKRCLRIFPALIVCILFCGLLVGPLFTSLKLHAYFQNRQTYSFLFRNSIMRPAHDLPGVFSNHPMHAVDGSLWSLPFEFAMYLVVLGLGITRRLNRVGVAILLVAFLAFRIVYVQPGHWETDFIYRHEFDIDYMSNLGSLFLCGTLLLMFKDVVPLDWRICASCLLVMGASLGLPPEWRQAVSNLFLPYVVIYVAFLNLPWLRAVTRYGDFSYGVYVYAFPVQQMVLDVALTRRLHLRFSAFVVICTVLTLILGMLSWFLVEKPMLKLKKKPLHAVSSAAAQTSRPMVGARVVGAK